MRNNTNRRKLDRNEKQLLRKFYDFSTPGTNYAAIAEELNELRTRRGDYSRQTRTFRNQNSASH